MALKLNVMTPPSFAQLGSTSTRYVVARTTPSSHRPTWRIRCVANVQTQEDSEAARKAGTYTPTIWDYDFVESLKSDYASETYATRADKLKQDVRSRLVVTVDPLARLKLIDVLERLGVGYLFEKEIQEALQAVYSESSKQIMKEDLYATALHFRILRQHGHEVPQDVFNEFIDEKGKFKESLSQDVQGLLSLYEASYLGAEGESILDEAREFTKGHLKHLKENVDSRLAKQLSHALEIPLQWRMLRPENRWFIEVYEEQEDMDPTVLELAKLDFNMVQAVHQRDLRTASRWWRNLGLAQKLSFARDRLVESFLWSAGVTYEPQYRRCRNWLTKVMKFVLVLDDIYDVYGSLEELEIFTDAVERWDTAAMAQLPDYMKMSFLALFNTTNEMAYEILKEQGWDILPYLRKAWAGFIKAMFQEAKWYHKNSTPPVEDYLKNGWVSSSGTVFLVHAFFATGQEINKDVLDYLENTPDLIYGPSMIFRLSNDLATSSAELERGDVSSSIHCYMVQHNASEQVAREYIRGLTLDVWKKMNKSISNSPFSLQFVNFCLNLARTSLCIYQYGDGLGAESNKSKDHVLSLIIQPLGIESHKAPVNGSFLSVS
ncbi:PREDICTED: alpha-terpineol synthase, chloroplastic-like [Nelumbo nucifera]|nr:PREDICTED: alpha-terpineol synthase, chloroplastic-like [Nelumbo nucifera]